MGKNLRLLFIGTNKIFMDAISKKFKHLGYNIEYQYSYSILEITDNLKYCNLDLIVSLVDKVTICTQKVAPLISSYAPNIPWLAMVYKVSQEEIFSLLDAGCNEVISLEDLDRLAYIIHRLYVAANKKNSESNLLKEALTEKEELSFILSSIGDGVITVDKEEQIVMMNGMAELITGWSMDLALGKPFKEVLKLINLNTREPYQDLVEQSILSGQAVGLKQNTVIVTKDGQEKYLSASISPIKVKDDVVGVVIVFRDITRIRQTEIDLMIEQRNLSLLFDAAPIGLLLVDEKGIIKKTNRAILETFGKEEDKVVGCRLGVGLGCKNSLLNGGESLENPPCQGCQLWQVLNETFGRQEGMSLLGVDVCYPIVTSLGRKDLWLKINSVPIVMDGKNHVMLVIDDITGIKVAEEVLKRYQFLSQHANDIIIFSDIDGLIIEANEAALAAYGYNKKEIINKSIFDLMDSETQTKVRPQFHRAIETGLFYEALAKRKNGGHFPVEVSLQSTEIGGVEVLLSIQRDITECKRTQKELEQARKNAEEANQAKSEFLANMSHEIRTPLNGMLGMIDLTLLTSLDQEQKDNLYIAKDCAASLLNLINDILDFSKIEARKLSIESLDFNLRELLNQVIKAHMLKVREKGLTLQSNVALEIPLLLRGDPNRLKQILNNLLSNAIKFTEKGGIEVLASLNNLAEDQVGLTISIVDTGIGIEEKHLKKIFATFNQADNTITRKYGGSGLGLPISKQLVEMMGGTLEVESIPGKGSKFQFNLTFARGTSLPEENGEVKAVEKAPKPYKILLAEDDKVNQLVLIRMLKAAGHLVDAVSNGLELLEKLNVEDYDLLILDIEMPKMDGLEATKRIRLIEKKIGGHIPIIAISAYALAGDREKYLNNGMDEYLTKPIQINKLLGTIEKIGGKFAGKGNDTFRGLFSDLIYISEDKNVETSDSGLSEILGDTSQDVQDLSAACHKKDYGEIEECAHKIKSRFSVEGLMPLRRLIFKIELAARKEDIDAINEYLKEFFKSYNDLRESLVG